MFELFGRPPTNVEPVRDPFPKPVSPLDSDEATSDGAGIVVKGEWSDPVTRYVHSKTIEAVYLNSAKGWRGRDYGFLRDIETVRCLHILTSRADDLSAIGDMSALEKLTLACRTRSPIDFPALKNLRQCYLSWWSKAESIFDCPGLEILYLDEFKTADHDRFDDLRGLRKLTIGNSTIPSVRPLAGLPRLVKLVLLNCSKIDSLNGIEELNELRWLAVSGSHALSSIEPVAALEALEILDLSDCSRIASLAPLAGLRNLKALTFAGTKTTVEDGDLSVLETLPRLSMLNFVQRPHYTHRLVKRWNWRNFDNPDTLLVPA